MYLEEFKNRVLPVKNKLYQYAIRFLHDEDEAKDMVQEVFLKIWHKKESMSKYQNMEAWCMKMIRNLCLDKIKSKQFQVSKMKVSVDIKLEDRSPFEHLAISDTMQRVEYFVSQLPEKQKLIFNLRDIGGHSYQEICDMTDLDMNQVKVNLFRARKFLRDKIKNAEAYGL